VAALYFFQTTMPAPLHRPLRTAVLLALWTPLALAAAPKPPVSKVVDIGPVKSQLQVLDDGKGHFLVVLPFGAMEQLYWGDGQVFWAQRVSGGSSEGTVAFDRVFWEPRVRERWKASFGLKDGVFTLRCDDRTTVFRPTEGDKSKAILDGATFHAPRWQHRAYALARDDTGTYYYVDRSRDDDVKDFRLWAGPRGQLKPLAMTNVVSDSEGDIFATRTGELRLVLDKKESAWVKGKARTTLKLLPLEDNVQLIYSELGVYAGEPLGTPCDLL
jgi:hypothetical protein